MLNASINILKAVQKLKMSKFRNLEQKFIVEGDKMILESIQSVPDQIQAIFITDNTKLSSEILTNYLTYKISVNDLERISSHKNPQHSLAVVGSTFKVQKSNKDQLVLICDGIQDPGNFGTIIRTADWFGIQSIVASKNTVDRFNPKVIQASMGSIYRVDVTYENIVDWLRSNNRLKLATTLAGDSLYNFKTDQDLALIIGNEGNGVSPEVLEIIDYKVTIPGHGKAESLNASVASGIVIAHLTKLFYHD